MKRLITFAFLLFFTIVVKSQESQSKPGSTLERNSSGKAILTTRFGFKGGYNKSIINGRDSMGGRMGYIGFELYGSFFAETRVGERLVFENELLVSWTNDYHFIEVPLHLKHLFNTKWSAFAGPKLDFLIDNDNDYFETNYTFRNFGVSLELGAQYNITDWLLVESRYSRGLVNQVTDKGFDINKGKRNTIRVGAGIRF